MSFKEDLNDLLSMKNEIYKKRHASNNSIKKVPKKSKQISENDKFFNLNKENNNKDTNKGNNKDLTDEFAMTTPKPFVQLIDIMQDKNNNNNP